jgi:hypothetical protein
MLASWKLQIADCHSVEKLGFQLLGKTGLSCRQARWEVLCLCALWGSRLLVLSREKQVTTFVPSVWNLSFSLFDGGVGALQLSGTVAQWHWASVHLGWQAFQCLSLSSRLQLSSPQWVIWCFFSFTEKWGLSCGQVQWEPLGLFVP